MPNANNKTLVCFFVFSQNKAGQNGQKGLEPLPHSAKAQARLRAIFESKRYCEAGFEVLDLPPCSNAGEVQTMLKTQIGNRVRECPNLNVVLVWSGHGQTFDGDLRLATLDCVHPLNEASGIPAKELVIQCGAKMAHDFCVVIDACEAGGAVLEFASVAAARQWRREEHGHTFSAFYASYPFERAKDGVYLSLLASILEVGPSLRAETELYREYGNVGFSDKNRLLSAAEVDQGIYGEIRANPELAHGVSIPGATVFGRQYLFPNPRFCSDARARLVDQTALDTHFLPKARGIELNELREVGWHFTGRIETIQDILEWVASPANNNPRLYILTGDGGTGKSALVGRLIALADFQCRERLRSEGWNEEEDRNLGTLPPLDAFDTALHLRNLTAQGTVEQLADLLGLDRPDSPEAFIESAEKQGKPGKLLVFDALDEAENPAEIVLRVIRPLAHVDWRALVATRRRAAARGTDDLLVLLASVSMVHELGADAQTSSDIAAYVSGRLRASGSPQFSGNPLLIERASQKIAERANGNFLYARIATSNLLRCFDKISVSKLDRLLRKDIGGVFSQDLDFLDRAFRARFQCMGRGATRLLEALAWAQGKGVPFRDGLWAAMANAVAKRSSPGTYCELDDTHIHWLLYEAGRYILEDGDGEQAVYRLFHQSLIDHFRPRPNTAKAQAIASALNHVLYEGGGWRYANPYLLRHMAAHWAACKSQTQLHRLLLNFAFIQTRLNRTGIPALLKDYIYVGEPQPLPIARLERTLSMTAHILQQEPQQLIPQLLGRLPPDSWPCQQLRKAARQAIDRPILIPWLGGLRQPGALILVIEGACVAFSPDGTRLASGSDDDGTVRLWDARTGEALGEPWRGHENLVSSVAFSPDGTRLASGSYDGTVRLWDARTGKALGEPWRGHERGVSSVTFSPDGTRLASGSNDGTVRLWDARMGEALGEPWRGHERGVSSVAFSPDGTRLASGSYDGTVRLWDARTGEALGEPLRGHENLVSSVAFSPDGTRLASGSHDGTVRLWDARTGKALGEPWRGHERGVSSVAFSPDGTRLASGSDDDGTVRLWDARTGEALGKPWRGHERGVSSVAFSPDGTRLASGSDDDGTVRLWDARTGEALGEPWRGHEGGVSSVAFSPDGTRLASGSYDGTVRLWDARMGEALGEPWRGHEGGVSSVAFSPDGTRLASGSNDGTVRLWDVRSSRCEMSIWLDAPVSSVAVCASAPQFRIVAGLYSGALVWLDLVEPLIRRQVPAHSRTLQAADDPEAGS